MKSKVLLLLLIVVLLTALLLSCAPAGTTNDGKIIVTAKGLNGVCNGHAMNVAVMIGFTPEAASSAVVSGGSATVNSFFSMSLQPWTGKGGTTYTVVIGVNVDDDGTVGNTGDYMAPLRQVTINGDITISLTGADFTVVP